MKTTLQNNISAYEKIFSFENLFSAWQEFRHGKKNKRDVAFFASKLIHNLSTLENELLSGIYKHGGYAHFKIADPKPRDIHKASVRDRVVHHALYRALYPYFDNKFIHDSYSCRISKGTHRAIYRFEDFTRKIGKNNRKTAWVLKGDIRKCFASVDHAVLKKILRKHIICPRTMSVIESIIDSFKEFSGDKGVPLGNLTSQLFINIYLNELDQFVKRRLQAKVYIRYADDFVILSQDKAWLSGLIPKIEKFLAQELRLALHPQKVSIETVASGVDFLGWIHFPKHRVLRTVTKRRIFKKIKENSKIEVIQSYLGLLSHGNAYKLRQKIKGDFWPKFW